MNELHLFAGAGGGILAGHLLGHRCVCAVEWEPYAQAVLVARQNDGSLPAFPIWDDVQTFDGKPWSGVADIVAGGFPCQDISVAGRGAGITGAKSGMWTHMARIIGEVRPVIVYVENSPALLTRGLGTVLGDLASLGYDAKWGVLGAADVGAPHKRDRIWIHATDPKRIRYIRSKSSGRVPYDKDGAIQACQPDRGEITNAPIASREDLGDSNSSWESQLQGMQLNEWGRIGDPGAEVSNANGAGLTTGRGNGFDHERSSRMDAISGRQALADSIGPGLKNGSGGGSEYERIGHGTTDYSSCASGEQDGWPTEPGMGRMVDGVAFGVDRLKAIGNGQVPRVAATAFNLLSKTA